MSFSYVSNFLDLAASVASYAEQTEKLETLPKEVAREVVRLLPRQNLWIAVRDAGGQFLVAPSKYAGHVGLDLQSYVKHLYEAEGSAERLDGTEADRRINELGGSEVAVRDSSHAAAVAVRELCRRFGKSPKSVARVRVFDDPPLVSSAEIRPEDESFTAEEQAVLRKGLTIAQAKQALANKLGCRPSSIEIIIRA